MSDLETVHRSGFEILVRGACEKWAARHARLVNALFVVAYLAAGYAILEYDFLTHPLPVCFSDLIFVQAADINVHMPSDDLQLLLELKPNTKDVQDDSRHRVITINSLGLRDPERSVRKPPGTFRIIMLGTSTAYGAEVSDDETMTVYMERILNENPPAAYHYEVWNAGISSYTPTQMAALGRKLIGMGCEPDLILFQNYLLGPRAFLKGYFSEKLFARDVGLFSEHLLMPFGLSPEVGARMSLHSRTLFYGIMAYNAWLDTKHRRDRLEALIQTQAAHHLTAMKIFSDDFKDRYRMVSFQFACRKEEDFGDLKKIVAPTGMPLWCLRPEKDEPLYLVNHPPGYVYESYARILINMLKENSYL